MRNRKAYAVILAGGAGSRLWPISRRARPKPLLQLGDHRTLLQITVGRLKGLIPASRTLVVAARERARDIRSQLPDLPRKNLLLEPIGRNTAASLGLAALRVHELDPKGLLAVLPADHQISDAPGLRRLLKAALAWAQETEDIVIFGVRPDRPETGYGYIRRGEPVGRAGAWTVHRATAFVEKPGLRRVRQYLSDGQYEWNSGMFVLSAARALSEIKGQIPKLHRGLLRLGPTLTHSRGPSPQVFRGLPAISIDHGILVGASRAGSTALLPCRVGWNDVGDFGALARLAKTQKGGHRVWGTHLGIETRDTILYAPGKLIATLGVENLIVVDTQDAVLICPKDRAQEVRRLVEALSRKDLKRYL